MSRSEAERCVLDGRVALNGRMARDPREPCNPERDRILVDGRPLKARRKVYLAMNKPVGTITTARDPEGRPTAYDLLPSREENLQAVGRLDADTSGLLLFTNDTAFAARITGSSSGVEKIYEARISGSIEAKHARAFESGIVLDGKLTLPARVRVLDADETSTRVEIALTEGRNRQIRRMWEALGLEVLALERKRIGPISLGDLGPGEVRAVTEFERATLQVPER
jgi:23S rRNA pseudouridine2605 synthase